MATLEISTKMSVFRIRIVYSGYLLSICCHAGKFNERMICVFTEIFLECPFKDYLTSYTSTDDVIVNFRIENMKMFTIPRPFF